MGASGDGGPTVNAGFGATSAQISGAGGLAADLSGNLYLVDTNNYRIRKVTPDGVITSVVGIGQWGSPHAGDAAASAPVLGPMGLAMDRSGNLYITDVVGDDELSAEPLLDVAVTIGGVPAAVQYAGGVPGQIAGLMQINVHIPRGVAAGGYVPVIVRIGDASTPPDARVDRDLGELK